MEEVGQHPLRTSAGHTRVEASDLSDDAPNFMIQRRGYITLSKQHLSSLPVAKFLPSPKPINHSLPFSQVAYYVLPSPKIRSCKNASLKLQDHRIFGWFVTIFSIMAWPCLTHVALFGCTVATHHFQREACDANDERLSSVLLLLMLRLVNVHRSPTVAAPLGDLRWCSQRRSGRSTTTMRAQSTMLLRLSSAAQWTSATDLQNQMFV